MPILVTGGAGFIGSNLVDRLLDDGCDVVALDNFDTFYSHERKAANLAAARRRSNFRLIEADLRDNEHISRLIIDLGPSAIVHLAAKAGVRPSIEHPADYTAVNVAGTVHLLEAACRLKTLPKFIYASSSSVYGYRPDAPFRETDQVDTPISPYAASKKACELFAHTFHHLHGLPVTGLRFFTAFGPRNRPDLAIAKFTRLIDRGEAIPMFGDGSSSRDYTYVDDIVDGIVRAMHHCATHHLYNLGNSAPTELRQMISRISDELGKPARIDQRPEQPGDVRQTFADISRAQREIGYNPRTSFHNGIGSYVQWYREELKASRQLS